MKVTITTFLFLTSILGHAQTTGLKKINYQDETSDKKDEQNMGTALSPQETQKLLKDVEIIKLKQAEGQKALDELDNDE